MLVLFKLVNIGTKVTDAKTVATRTATGHTGLWSARAIRCVNAFDVLEPRTIGKLVCLFPLEMAWAPRHHLKRSHDAECEEPIRRCEELALEFKKKGLPALCYICSHPPARLDSPVNDMAPIRIRKTNANGRPADRCISKR